MKICLLIIIIIIIIIIVLITAFFMSKRNDFSYSKSFMNLIVILLVGILIGYGIGSFVELLVY
jgi:VIT1/CCC1 family predicted Fe2+/Mn2+ transporter